MKLGRYGQAKEAFVTATKKKERNIPALGNLGYIALLEGNWNKAVSFLQLVLQHDPKNPRALRQLALARMFQGNTQQAFTLLQHSLSLSPEDPFTLLELSALYTEKGLIRKKQKTMDYFFKQFGANSNHLETFVDNIAGVIKASNALARHARILLILIANESRKRSQEFENIADQCLKKKGEPAS